MRFAFSLLALMVPVVAQASTVTVATFADPALDATMPLFMYDAIADELSGGWSDPGLDLETIGGTFPDATFVMTAASGGLPGTVGPGEVVFNDNGGAELFRIVFDSGQLSLSGFGATEFLATNDVVFSGSILPGPVEAESFAFSFSNLAPVGGDGSYSATASFTSSATVIPEPATMALLVFGGSALVLRRRR